MDGDGGNVAHGHGHWHDETSVPGGAEPVGRSAPTALPRHDGPAPTDVPPSRLRHLRGDGRPGTGWRYHLWCFVRQWRVTHALWATMALLAAYLALTGRTGPVWIALSALGLAMLPAAIEGLSQIRLPRGLVLAVGLYVGCTIVAGELWDAYQRVGWWDDAMHAMSGAVIALIGLTGALTLLGRARSIVGPVLPLLFGWFTALGVAGAWELFEYGLDAGFGYETQAGLADTMHDIGWGALGAGLATLAGAAHLAGAPTGWFGRALERAVAGNLHLVRAGGDD